MKKRLLFFDYTLKKAQYSYKAKYLVYYINYMNITVKPSYHKFKLSCCNLVELDNSLHKHSIRLSSMLLSLF